MKRLNNWLLLQYVKYYLWKQRAFDWYEEMDKKYNLLRKGDKDK